LKVIISILFCFLAFHLATAQQRIVAECTVVYKVESQIGPDRGMLQKATKTVYIKSNNARIDLVAPSYSQSTIYNKTTATATVLRSFGEDKYMTPLNVKQWRKVNAALDSIQIRITNDSISILDYTCKKAILQLKDGVDIIVFFTPAIVPSVREYEYMFKDIPGFVLGYEMMDAAGIKTVFRATQINLYNPVSASRFDIPTKDYRVIAVDDSIKL
jgi:GLPGLI family protein